MVLRIADLGTAFAHCLRSSACVWLFWCAGLATAFDTEAHDAIGQTAASAMDQQAIKQVKRLLGGQDTSDVAGWGHQVDDTYPGMAKLHFQRHSEPFCGKPEEHVANCEDNICLLAALKHFYGRILKDEGRKIDYPQIDISKVASGLKFSDADAVKMLINLIGDLHQPMHVGYISTDMGRNIMVKFRGKEMSLYDWWDKGISETVRNDEPSFWLGGWTHMSRIKDEFEKDKEEWKKEGAFKMFEKWTTESVKFACDTVYHHPGTAKMLAGPGAETPPVIIDEAAYQEWRSAWLRQILLAGERTAVVLNDILDASGAAKLSEGSQVKTKADEEKRLEDEQFEKERQERRKNAPASLPSKQVVAQQGSSFSNFITNLCIAVIVVPSFLMFAQHGLDPKALQSLLEKLTESGGGSSGPQGPSYSSGNKRSN
jgi:hypothetical protein